MHRAYTRLWLQNKKKNVRVRSFQELDLDPGVAVGARVAQTLKEWLLLVFITQNVRAVRGKNDS
jgi:hypothetical protein